MEERTPSAQLSASVIYFFVSHIGKGPIIRGDLGLGFFKSRFYPDTNKYPGSGLSFGLALLYGVGYGLPIGTSGTTILTTLSYAIRPGPQGRNRNTGERYPKVKVRVYGLTVGGLFRFLMTFHLRDRQVPW